MKRCMSDQARKSALVWGSDWMKGTLFINTTASSATAEGPSASSSRKSRAFGSRKATYKLHPELELMFSILLV